MILGMSFSTFTTLHVILSLIGIFTGAIALFGMIRVTTFPTMTALFLGTTILTSITGFFFPSAGFGPSHAVGILSLAVLTIAVLALYINHLAGAWRWLYVVSAVTALYFNVFVGVVQAFQKISFLRDLAPTQAELPFLMAQGVVLVMFIVLGIAAVRSFHPEYKTPALSSA